MSMKAHLSKTLSAAALAVLLSVSGNAVAQDAAEPVAITPPMSPQEAHQRAMNNYGNYWQGVQSAHNAWHNSQLTRQEALERGVDTSQTARELNNQAAILDWQNQQQAWVNAAQQNQSAYQRQLENQLKLQEAMMAYRHEQERINLERQRELNQNRVQFQQGNLNNAIMRNQNNLMTDTTGVNNALWAQRQQMLNQLARQRALLQRRTGGPVQAPLGAGSAPAAPAPAAPASGN